MFNQSLSRRFNYFSVNLHLRLNYGLQNMFIAGHFPCVHCGLMPVQVPVDTPEEVSVFLCIYSECC